MTDIAITRLPRQLADRRSTGWWAMVLAIASEATLFASLLAGYFYLRLNADHWRPEGVPAPELRLAGINTVVLVGSSIVLVWGERGMRANRLGRARAGVAATAVLGALFLVVQAGEYRRKTFGIADHAYGSAFYIVTGLHASHVAVGLALLLFCEARLWHRPIGDRHRATVQNVAIYWHFVDVVWLAVFSSLYLSERW